MRFFILCAKRPLAQRPRANHNHNHRGNRAPHRLDDAAGVVEHLEPHGRRVEPQQALFLWGRGGVEVGLFL